MKVAAAERKKENKYNILSGALIAFALCFTLFIYAPYELYVTNQLEFWFTAGQMLPYALGLFCRSLSRHTSGAVYCPQDKRKVI